jgi:hypothetical protein
LRYTARLTIVTSVALSAIWLLLTLAYPRQYAYMNPSGLEFTFIAGILSLLAGFALDFSSIASAVGSVSGEVTAGRWELLRLTPLTSRQIVAAKHGAAQVRAWRAMSLILATRIGVLVIFPLNLVYEYLTEPDYNLFSGAALLTVVAVLALMAGSAALFVLEPFWRMSAVTALGVAASARAGQPAFGILRALWSLFVFWAGQGLFVGAFLVVTVTMLFPLISLEVFGTNQLIFSPLILLVIIAVTVYGFYSIFLTAALRRAERLVAHLD